MIASKSSICNIFICHMWIYFLRYSMRTFVSQVLGRFIHCTHTLNPVQFSSMWIQAVVDCQASRLRTWGDDGLPPSRPGEQVKPGGEQVQRLASSPAAQQQSANHKVRCVQYFTKFRFIPDRPVVNHFQKHMSTKEQSCWVNNQLLLCFDSWWHYQYQYQYQY